MPGPPQSHAKARQGTDIAARRSRVAEAYLQGHKQADIAAREGVDISTVSRDLKAIEEAWGKSALVNLHAAKVRELERIDAVEREAWEAWRRSQREGGRDRTEVEKEVGHRMVDKEPIVITGTVKTVRMRHARDGTVDWLKVIQTCIEQRIRLLGLDRLGETGDTETVRELLDSLADLRAAHEGETPEGEGTP